MKLYNTLNRRIEEVKPNKKGKIKLYACGPTVYWHMHVGNLMAYTFVDVLRRSFEYTGYEVEHVMNMTDVGHLTDDGDEGDDKLEESAKKQKKDVWEIAQFYIDSVKSDWADMNYLDPTHLVRATEHIEDMIEMNKKIEENGYTYETDEALYFDVTKFHDYTRLQGGQDLADKKVGVRDEVNVDSDKKNPADFALWLKGVGKYEKHSMQWDSPWGKGFPGWHIECSAMGTAILGDNIDIHTGGEDHIAVHHTNERAQNYGAFGHEVVKMWVHNNFITVDGGKMGKSKGNVYEMSDVKEQGFDPMDIRYFFLQAQYRARQNFSWELVKEASVARKKLVDVVNSLQKTGEKGEIVQDWKVRFISALENDLNMPQALAVLWELVKSDEISDPDKLATILDFDQVLGLRLGEIKADEQKIDPELKKKIEQLVKERDEARAGKNWGRADEIRDELTGLKVEIEDTSEGAKWKIV